METIFIVSEVVEGKLIDLAAYSLFEMANEDMEERNAENKDNKDYECDVTEIVIRRDRLR